VLRREGRLVLRRARRQPADPPPDGLPTRAIASFASVLDDRALCRRSDARVLSRGDFPELNMARAVKWDLAHSTAFELPLLRVRGGRALVGLLPIFDSEKPLWATCLAFIGLCIERDHLDIAADFVKKAAALNVPSSDRAALMARQAEVFAALGNSERVSKVLDNLK
jgi:hypothetical protein